jgi:hypothetical protein
VSKDDRCVLGANQEVPAEPLERGNWESGEGGMEKVQMGGM